MTADGKPGPSRAVATVTRARLAGFPRLARAGGAMYLAYTAPGTDGGIRVVRLGSESLTQSPVRDFPRDGRDSRPLALNRPPGR